VWEETPRRRSSRLAVGWRLVLFLALVVAFVIPGSLLALPGLPGQALPLLLAALGAGWILLALDRRPPGALGFHLGRGAVSEAGAGLLLGVGAALVAILLMTAVGGLSWGLEPGSPRGLLAAAGVSLALLALPAAAEEALLRGYLFQASAERFGWGWTLAWTSVAFSVLHLGNPGLGWTALVNLGVAGVFLGLLLLRTASLWWATGAHLGWNWAQMALGLPVSGLELVEVPVLIPETRGPTWLGGGAFGMEGSVAATAVLLVLSVWLWRGGGAGWIRLAPGAISSRSLLLEGEAARRPGPPSGTLQD